MIRAILTDIEGTTSALSFVKDVLFPYSRARLAGFVEVHGGEPEVTALLDEARALAGKALGRAETVAQLIRWIDEDRKAPPLKALQGMIWEQGYQEGDFHGHLYEDAARKLREWKDAGLDLYVFSSGSVQAQKLLFGHTEYGDLTPLFTDYFDTRVGPKQEPESYRRIAARIGLPPEEILFLSDIGAELEAARLAGFATCQLVRGAPGTEPGTDPVARNFDEVIISL
jgi:enolase-phosphatase E1